MTYEVRGHQCLRCICGDGASKDLKAICETYRVMNNSATKVKYFTVFV